MTQPFLSIIIPSYNELVNLQAGVLDEVSDFLKRQKYSWEVILSDDGSSDGTSEALDQLVTRYYGWQVLHNPHRGKAATVSAGMLAATGQWRLFTDFDQSTPISEVVKLLDKTTQGYQIVIGSREGEGARRDQEPWIRHLMGRVFNLVVRVMTVPKIQDTQCGFKLFSATATDKLFPNLKVYGGQTPRQDAFTGAFDVELLFLGRRQGLKIAEVPITWRHRHTDRVSPIKDSFRMFRDVLRIRLAAWQGVYKS